MSEGSMASATTTRLLSRVEWAVLILVTGAAIGALAFYYVQITPLRHLDSVFLFESLESVARGYLPASQTVATWPTALATFSQPAAAVCSAPLAVASAGPYSIFDNHAYLALIPLGWISAGFGPELTLAVANAVAHVLLLTLCYVFLRRRGVGPAAAAAFAACVALYSGWSLSALGDYYVDRLYMPFALGALYFGYRLFFLGEDRKAVLTGFIICAACAASCTERAAMMMLGLIGFLLAFAPRSTRPSRTSRLAIAALGGVLLAYLVAYFAFFFEGIERGGSPLANVILGADAWVSRVQDPKFAAFVLGNALFGTLALFAGWRLFLLLIGSMVPNLLITTGGAELNGWVTHYHAMYVPFLLFVAASGYSRILAALPRSGGRVFAAATLASATAWASVLDPTSGKIGSPSTTSVRDGILGRAHAYFQQGEHSADHMTAMLLRRLAQAVPPGARVATVEAGMPALFRGRSLTYYPLGIDEADYVVASGVVSGADLSGLDGAVSYLGATEQESLNRCLASRLASEGFRVAASEPGVNLVVLARGTPR